MNKPQRIATIVALVLFAGLVVYHAVGPDNGLRYGNGRPEVGFYMFAVAVLYAGAWALLKRGEP